MLTILFVHTNTINTITNRSFCDQQKMKNQQNKRKQKHTQKITNSNETRENFLLRNQFFVLLDFCCPFFSKCFSLSSRYFCYG